MSNAFSDYPLQLRKKYFENLLYNSPGYIFVYVEIEKSISQTFKPKM